MVEGHKMDLVYYDPYPNKKLEDYIKKYGDLLESCGEKRVVCRRLETMKDVMKEADVSQAHSVEACLNHGLAHSGVFEAILLWLRCALALCIKVHGVHDR